MRLSPKEQTAIVQEIRNRDQDAVIYLYGSRTDNQLKGGDIDLLVVSQVIGYRDKVDILLDIKARIGEQKIDLKVVSAEALAKDAFVQSILPTAIRL